MAKKHKENSYHPSDEIFEGSSFFMARSGQQMLMHTTASCEGVHAWLEAIRDTRGEAETNIQNKIQEIDNLILGYDPLDVIAHMSLRNSYFETENINGYKTEITPAYTEYIALLCLTRSYESFQFQNPKRVNPALVEILQEKVKELFQAETMNIVMKYVDPEKSGQSALDRLRFLSVSDSLLARYSAYHHHLIETLQGIFSPLGAEMEASLGFNISEAISVLDGVDRVRLLKLSRCSAEATDFEQKLRKAIRDFRNHKRRKQFVSEFSDDLLDNLTKEKSKAAKRKIRDMVTSWAFYAMSDTVFFRVDELAELTQFSPEKITLFLDRFSLAFGGVEEHYRRPAATHPLMRKPFVKHGDKYLCPVPETSYWAIRPEIEDLWNPQSTTSIVKDDVIWQKYQIFRIEYFQKTAAQYLADCVKIPSPYRRVKYAFGAKGDKSTSYPVLPNLYDRQTAPAKARGGLRR